jgi:hypothetical protein
MESVELYNNKNRNSIRIAPLPWMQAELKPEWVIMGDVQVKQTILLSPE